MQDTAKKNFKEIRCEVVGLYSAGSVVRCCENGNKPPERLSASQGGNCSMRLVHGMKMLLQDYYFLKLREVLKAEVRVDIWPRDWSSNRNRKVWFNCQIFCRNSALKWL
jgi:hypothetical protein